MITKNFIRVLLVASLTTYSGYYFYTNPKGIMHQKKLAAENTKLKQKITLLEQEISTLQTNRVMLESDPFEKEKVMREDLHMSYTNEYVYLLPTK